MKPLLAHIYEPHRVTYPCYVQPKLNGIRALYQNGTFVSRDEVVFSPGLLDHLAQPLLRIFGPDVILDGELYVHGWPLQRINAAVTPVRKEPNEDTLKVEYHVFDVVDFKERFFIRQAMRPRCAPIHCVPTYIADDEAIADARYAEFVADGYEGMMYRLGNCPYTIPNQAGSWGRSRFLSDKNNRCWHLLKRKDWQDDEFEWGATFEGEGKLTGMLGSFGCIAKNGKTFQVGSGLTEAERIFYWNNPPNGKKIKVKYLVLSEAGIPLNPTIEAIL